MTASRDKKGRLARRGIELIDAASPDKIREKVQESVSDAASGMVLDAVQALTGDDHDRQPGPVDAAIAERKVSGTLTAIDDHGKESFDRRLAAAAAAGPKVDSKRQALGRALDELRASFPQESREFAVLIFSCMELIGALREYADGGAAPSQAELARKEALLVRVAALLEPQAAEALRSFVTHIVATSRTARQSG